MTAPRPAARLIERAIERIERDGSGVGGAGGADVSPRRALSAADDAPSTIERAMAALPDGAGTLPPPHAAGALPLVDATGALPLLHAAGPLPRPDAADALPLPDASNDGVRPPVAAALPATAPAPAAMPRPATTVALDLPHLIVQGAVVDCRSRTPIAEQFRQAKRPLLKVARDGTRGAQLIAVTSALPGEGKTFCALNLALSIAVEVDTPVVLIDADTARPSVFARLGLDPSGPGLMELLAHPGSDLADALVATNVPQLELMRAGSTQRARAPELFAGPALPALLQRLSARHRNTIVVLDAPPLLPSNEARVLAGRVGQVLMVVAAGSTPRAAIGAALEILRPLPAVSLLLNRTGAPGAGDAYGYGYGYGYGYAAETD